MFTWPVPGPVTRGFHYKSWIYVGGQHAAIDIAASDGTPIVAVADGTVVDVGWDALSGNRVAIQHADGWRSTYRHLQSPAPLNLGDSVGKGQVVGYVGNTGLSEGPHLHFDLWNRNKIRDDAGIFYKNGWYALDPELYLGQEDDVLTPEDKEWLLKWRHDLVYTLLLPLMIEVREGGSQGGGASARETADELARRLQQ